MTRHALPHLRASKRGSVVNVGSLAGCVPLPGAATYSATKAGMRFLTYALADEGHRVSLVSPGPVETGFIMDQLDDVADIVFAQPMSTAGQIADLVLDCADDGAVERQRPRISGRLATVGYLSPWFKRVVRPLMERRGRAVKERYRQRRTG